ncbi:MAG: PAS domain S-box protein [Deltaproteobacteria bacterium]|nr:PAS domain S-box protein [Deltaproteobacteria bacterium]
MSTKPTYEELEQRVQELEQAVPERKKTEELLRSQKQFFFLLINYSSDILVFIDKNGEQKFISPSAEKITGYTVGELQRPFAEIIHPEDLPRVERGFEKLLNNPDAVITVDYRHKHKDGGYRYFETVGRNFLDNPLVQGIVCNVRDITERKQSEQAILREQNFLKQLMETSPVGITVVDREGQISLANFRAEEILGLKRSDIYNRRYNDPAWQITDSEGNKYPEEELPFQLAKRKKVPVFGVEHGIVWPDGKRTLLSVNGAPLFDSEGNFDGMVSTIEDVTNRKRKELQLRDRNQFIQTILDNLPIGLAVNYFDEGTATYINKQFQEIYGWPEEELKNIPEFFEKVYPDPDYREELQTQVLADIESGDPGRMQWDNLKATQKDGSKRIISAKNIPIIEQNFMISTVQDVTERKQAQDALLESEEKYRLLVEKADEAIFIAQDDIVKFPNPKTLELTGYSEEELATIPFADLIHPEDRQMVVERYRRRLNGEKPPSDYAFRIINKSNSVLWVQNNVSGITWEGRPASINLLRNISEKRQLEEQLRQSQRMEAIGTLTGGIAHDYNNLMSIIMGNLSLAQEEMEPGSLQADFLSEATAAAVKVRDLTHELMSLSRGGKPVKEVAPLNELLKSVINAIPPDSGISVNESISKDLWEAPHDSYKMGSVFRNVVTNAVEAMPDGGTLTVKAENLTLENKDPDLPLDPGDFVCISIQDRGKGILKEHMDKILEPYFSTKQRGTQKGMGLGLTTAYAIVKQHGGHIQIDSSLDAGTTVNIYIPAESGPKPMDSKIPSADKKTSPAKRVLVMDDEEMLRTLAQKMLERMGFAVETVNDGLEAIDAYRRERNSGKPFDAVILDLTIKGGMGGEQTIRELLKIDPDIKAIVSSGYFNDSVMSDFQKYGFMGAMAKPYSKENLKKTIETLFG